MKKENIALASEVKDCKAELRAAEIEIQSLKKSNAGLKGVNTERGKKIKELEHEIYELNTQRQRTEKEFSTMAEQTRKILREKDRLQANIKTFNTLPWYKRIFAKVSE